MINPKALYFVIFKCLFLLNDSLFTIFLIVMLLAFCLLQSLMTFLRHLFILCMPEFLCSSCVKCSVFCFVIVMLFILFLCSCCWCIVAVINLKARRRERNASSAKYKNQVISCFFFLFLLCF